MNVRRHHYATSLVWTGNAGSGTAAYRGYERAHEISVPGKRPIHGSSDPAFRGDSTRWNPEELVVAALSACHMLAFLHRAALAGVTVVTYTDHAQGTMEETPDGGGAFTGVVLRPQVTVQTAEMAALCDRLHDEAHAGCYLAGSVSFLVRHESTVDLQGPGTPPPGPRPSSSAAWEHTRESFIEAANWFVDVTAGAEGRWNEVALGEWTVRDLVGHTSRALLTVRDYLGKPADTVDVASAVGYFRRVLALAMPADVARRGRDAGTALGTDVPTAIARIADEVTALVRRAGPDELLATPAGGMRLSDYLPTRTFELTVHTCDLAAALGRPLDVPENAGRDSLALLSGLATQAGQAGALLRGATGRGGLPPGFTLL